jgi:transposase
MHRLDPDVLQQLWDLRASGASLRGVAVALGISRNTVRRYVRRAVHGSAFPSPADVTPVWHARVRELLAEQGPGVRATRLATQLRAEGLVVTARSVQRTLAAWRLRDREKAAQVIQQDQLQQDLLHQELAERAQERSA